MDNSPLFALHSQRMTRFGVLSLVCTCLFLGACNSDKIGAEFESNRQLLFRGQYAAASQNMQLLLEENPRHRLAGRMSFLIAKAELGRGQLAESRRWFRETDEKYPGTEEANKARFKLAMLDFLEGNTESAQEVMSQLVESADGPYTPEAAAWDRYLKSRLK